MIVVGKEEGKVEAESCYKYFRRASMTNHWTSFRLGPLA